MTSWNNGVPIPESSEEGNVKPKFIKCTSLTHQLQTLVQLINGIKKEDSIAILLETNDSKQIHELNELRPGILEVYAQLRSSNINNLGYKHKRNDALIFHDGGSVNILTFHSAKGLEFNHVIIPFFESNFNNLGNESKINYVGFTRAIDSLTFLYTNTVSRNFPVIKNRSLYDGDVKYTDYSWVAKQNIETYNGFVDVLQEAIDNNVYTRQECVIELKNCQELLKGARNRLEMSGYNEQEIACFFRINKIKTLK